MALFHFKMGGLAFLALVLISLQGVTALPQNATPFPLICTRSLLSTKHFWKFLTNLDTTCSRVTAYVTITTTSISPLTVVSSGYSDIGLPATSISNLSDNLISSTNSFYSPSILTNLSPSSSYTLSVTASSSSPVFAQPGFSNSSSLSPVSINSALLASSLTPLVSSLSPSSTYISLSNSANPAIPSIPSSFGTFSLLIIYSTSSPSLLASSSGPRSSGSTSQEYLSSSLTSVFSTTASTPTPAPIVGPYEYYGCFPDSDGQSLSPTYANVKSEQACAILCSGYTLFGLENGNQCESRHIKSDVSVLSISEI